MATLGSARSWNYDNNNLDDKTFNIYLDTYGYLIGIEQVEDDVIMCSSPLMTVKSHLTNKTAEATAIFLTAPG